MKIIVIAVLIFIQILFGVNFTTSKVVVTEIDPFFWSNLRFLISGIIMLIFTLLLRRKHPPLNKEFLAPLLPLSLMGMSLGQTLFMIGLKNTTSVNTAIITTTIPILTLAIVIFRGEDNISAGKAIGFPLAMMGVAVVKGIENFKFSMDTLKGDFLVLMASLCFAAYLAFGKQYLRRFDNFWVTTWMFLISGILMAVFNTHHFIALPSLALSKELIYCASFSILGATILTYFLNNWALTRAPSGNVALFIYLQPVVAAVVGYFYLGEQITFRLIMGGVCIFSGLLVTLYRPKQKDQKSS